MSMMQIAAIPLLSDNYAWLLCSDSEGVCSVVDPAEALPVMKEVEARGLRLQSILATHHHWDHTGGIEELVAADPDLEILCSKHDLGRVAKAKRGIDEGEQLRVAGSGALCMLVPGHTLGAVAYYFEAERALFTGDTLFTAGCGRLFEGTAAQMCASLKRLAALPGETEIYCGHEYTEKNLRFARSVEPNAVAVLDRLAEVEKKRARREPTVPATLALERATNPFLRIGETALQKQVGIEDPVELFSELRRRRDQFNG